MLETVIAHALFLYKKSGRRKIGENKDNRRKDKENWQKEFSYS
jgi:hypothetical protein